MTDIEEKFSKTKPKRPKRMANKEAGKGIITDPFAWRSLRL